MKRVKEKSDGTLVGMDIWNEWKRVDEEKYKRIEDGRDQGIRWKEGLEEDRVWQDLRFCSRSDSK